MARREPRKKPRAAFRRFVYPAPNACWQLDGTEYTLATGVRCVVLQLQDDHSRLAVASVAAPGECTDAAMAVFWRGLTTHGVPQKLLTDNGRAFNTTRSGVENEFVKLVKSFGVEPITGKPYKPITQRKNERFHQTLFRWLDKQPPALTLAALQDQLDEFDHIYNTQRPHQGLPHRITPQQAWDATPVAEPPTPPPPQQPAAAADKLGRYRPNAEGTRNVMIGRNGTVRIANVNFSITASRAGETIVATWNPYEVVFADQNGQVILTRHWPPNGVRHVSNGVRPGRPRKHKPTESSPMS